MDRPPYRASQAARPAARPSQASREGTHTAATPASADAHRQAVAAQHHTTTKQPKSSKRRLMMWIAIVVAVGAVVAGGWFAWRALAADDGIDQGKYQYLKLSNGEEYYGKLAVLDDHNFKLTYVFYIKAQDNAEPSNAKDEVAKAQSNLQLIKMGNEVHGPEDAMIINRDQVLFYENLKTDGKVSQTINEYKDKQ